MNAVRRTSFVISSACVLTVVWAGLALAVPGVLDSTFSDDGRVTTNLAGGFAGANSVAVQANGKIVAAGGARGGGGSFAVARYNTDGTRDTTFGGDGKVTTDFTQGRDVASGVAIRAGRIVAAGRAGGFGRSGRFALSRYLVA